MDHLTGIDILHTIDRVARTTTITTIDQQRPQQHFPPLYPIECHRLVVRFQVITTIYLAIVIIKTVALLISVR